MLFPCQSETCNEHSESDFDAFYSQKAGVSVSVTVSPIITKSELGLLAA